MRGKMRPLANIHLLRKGLVMLVLLITSGLYAPTYATTVEEMEGAQNDDTSNQNEVEFYISGLVTDAEGDPLAGEPVLFQIYTGPYLEDQQIEVITRPDGTFTLQSVLYQEAYQASDRHCATLQITARLEGDGELIGYEPGDPVNSTSDFDAQRWANAGLYEDGEVLLFYSFHSSASESFDLEAFTVTMGSAQAPCRFQLGREPAEAQSVLLTVRHLDRTTNQPLAAEETYLLEPAQNPWQDTYPADLSEMAPLQIVFAGEETAEAAPGQPITGYQVDLSDYEGDQLPAALELIYYYHPDRDGDGIPDHFVIETLMTVNSEPLNGQETEPRLYAHQEHYEGVPPTVSGYLYQGYERDDQWYEQQIPREVITTDTAYLYRYRKRSSGGNAGGGSGGNVDDAEKPVEPGDLGEGAGNEIIDPEPGPNPAPEPEPSTEDEPNEEPVESEFPAPPEELPESPPPAEPTTSAQTRTESPLDDPPETQLSETEREELRNITFVKRSLRKEVAPGETVSYAFTGFENAFPYPLTDFTIIDQPDEGLDFVAIDLPAFRNGEGVTWNLSYRTNQRHETPLLNGHPADTAITIKAPPLEAQERITAVYVTMAQVPPGFGQGDQVTVTFQIGDDPPAEELHNKGLLYYKEQGEVMERQSEEEEAAIMVGRSEQLTGSGPGLRETIDAEISQFSQAAANSKHIWKYAVLLLALSVLAIYSFGKGRNRSTG